MRPVSSTLRALVIATACVFAGMGTAAANPPRWVVPYRGPAPVYTPGARLGTGVYIFPQISTTPSYYPVYPAWYGGPIYGGSIYGGSIYTPGAYYSSYSPYWGGSFYYTNPSYRYWYRIR